VHARLEELIPRIISFQILTLETTSFVRCQLGKKCVRFCFCCVLPYSRKNAPMCILLNVFSVHIRRRLKDELFSVLAPAACYDFASLLLFFFFFFFFFFSFLDVHISVLILSFFSSRAGLEAGCINHFVKSHQVAAKLQQRTKLQRPCKRQTPNQHRHYSWTVLAWKTKSMRRPQPDKTYSKLEQAAVICELSRRFETFC
jgi:hypothetical protein